MYKILLTRKHQEQDGTSVINDMYSKQTWRDHLKYTMVFDLDFMQERNKIHI